MASTSAWDGPVLFFSSCAAAPGVNLKRTHIIHTTWKRTSFSDLSTSAVSLKCSIFSLSQINWYMVHRQQSQVTLWAPFLTSGLNGKLKTNSFITVTKYLDAHFCWVNNEMISFDAQPTLFKKRSADIVKHWNHSKCVSVFGEFCKQWLQKWHSIQSQVCVLLSYRRA